MRKFFILLATCIICFAYGNESCYGETPATLIAVHVPIGYLCYHLYDDNSAEVTYHPTSVNNYPTLAGLLDIPSSVKNNGTTYTVTSIGNEAFHDCSNLSSVVIPNSVTSIGSHAFLGCENLTSITIPNSVTSIEELAFFGCSSLTSVTIPNSITSIGWIAFANCSNLSSVTLPNNTTITIGEDAFANCPNLQIMYAE